MCVYIEYRNVLHHFRHSYLTSSWLGIQRLTFLAMLLVTKHNPVTLLADMCNSWAPWVTIRVNARLWEIHPAIRAPPHLEFHFYTGRQNMVEQTQTAKLSMFYNIITWSYHLTSATNITCFGEEILNILINASLNLSKTW